jgi:hypothetical protein
MSLFRARRAATDYVSAERLSRTSDGEYTAFKLAEKPPKRKSYSSEARYCFQTTRPATMVAIGAPLNARRSNGELRDLLGESFTS